MLITIEILVAYNVNTVNTQPTQLIKSKASVNVSAANVSVTISFPEFFLRGGVSKCTPPQSCPKYTSATTICLEYVTFISGSRGSSTMNEWSINLLKYPSGIQELLKGHYHWFVSRLHKNNTHRRYPEISLKKEDTMSIGRSSIMFGGKILIQLLMCVSRFS